MRYDSRSRLPTGRVIENLREAVHEAASDRGVSSRLREIYTTWISGFVWWCLRTPPNQVNPHRVAAFLQTIKEHPKVKVPNVQNARGALTFFFEEVDVSELDLHIDPEPSISLPASEPSLSTNEPETLISMMG